MRLGGPWHATLGTAAVTLALLIGASPPARAEDATDESADTLGGWWANEPWRFGVAVYGWAPDIPVKIETGSSTTTLPIPLGTLLDDLQAAAMFEVQVHKGRVGAYFAPIVMFLEDREHIQGPIVRHKVTINDDALIADLGLSRVPLLREAPRRLRPAHELPLRDHTGHRRLDQREHLLDPARQESQRRGGYHGRSLCLARRSR